MTTTSTPGRPLRTTPPTTSARVPRLPNASTLRAAWGEPLRLRSLAPPGGDSARPLPHPWPASDAASEYYLG